MIYRIAALVFALAALHANAAPPAPVKTDVFIGGEDGFHTYRIPALAITHTGTVLAFCEARKNSPSDAGDIDLVLKRSTDGGATWGPMLRVHEEGGDAPITIGNPCPLIVHDSDTILLLFTRDNMRLFATRSEDDGQSWAEPRELTDILQNLDFPWLRVASGPVHGIQLRSGRLVAPMWYCSAMPGTEGIRYRAGVLLSDDAGASWHAGATVPEAIPRLNECTVLERKDRSLLLNMRAHKAGFRAVAESTDGGATWSTPVLDTNLPDPTCQGSILRLRNGDVAFANIPAASREQLSLRLSKDDGASWARTRLLEDGPSAYSDLAQRADGTLLCLYERGTARYNEKITVARVDPAWLEAAE